MDKDPKNLPEKLVLTAYLTAGLNAAVTLSYFILSIIAIVFRFNCSAGAPENVSGSQYFWNTAYRVYFQDEYCNNSMPMAELTSSYTVFIIMVLTLCASFIGFIASVTLISVVKSEERVQQINLAVYSHVGICFASLVVDLTLAVYFGLDYSYLGAQLSASSAGLGFNYEREVIRQAAFLLMTFTLKGYVFHVVNILLLVLLVVFLTKYQKTLKKQVHSIHKVGTLRAFDNPRRYDDWHLSHDSNPSFLRSPNGNNVFIEDEPPRTLLREPMRSNYSNNSRPYDRSDSWQRSQPYLNQGSRPFSYLEDYKRPVTVKPLSSPAVDPNWRKDPWPQAPSVPAPDYSPQTSKRLKSALKPAYM